MKQSSFQYYCKDEYLSQFPKDLFVNQFYKLYGLKKECATNLLQSREYVHLSTSEPCIISPLIDVTTVKIPYGRAAIPKLLKEIMNKNKMRASQALNSLVAMLYDPEKAAESLHFNVVGRLVRLASGREDFICTCALACLRVLSTQPGGKLAILKNECAIPVLKSLLKDGIPDVRHQAVLTTNTLAVNWTAVHTMVKDGYIQVVLELINHYKNPTVVLESLLELLEMLLDDGDSARILAITCDALDVVSLFSHNQPEVRKAAAAVIAQLFHCTIGKIAATHHNIIGIIKDKLNDPDEGFKSKLVAALMFATTDIEVRGAASNISIVTEMLEILSTYDVPTEIEICAMKVLTNLAELPKVRIKLRYFIGNVLSLPEHDKEHIQRHIDTLVDTIMWEP